MVKKEVSSHMSSTPSYLEYLDLLRKKNKKGMEDFSHYMQSIPVLDTIFSIGPSPYFLLDYRTGQYLFISENCKDIVGYSKEVFLENGVSFMLSLNHPDDLKVFQDAIFKRRLSFLHSIPPEEHKHYRFAFNHRVRRIDGAYIHVMQQCIILDSDSEGNPLLIFGMYTDITPYKSDHKIISTISKFTEEKGFITIQTDYYPEEPTPFLSRREQEILKLIIEGLSSKMIAGKLHISLNTVRTHRQNMLLKTSSKNTAELIKFAIAKGLL